VGKSKRRRSTFLVAVLFAAGETKRSKWKIETVPDSDILLVS